MSKEKSSLAALNDSFREKLQAVTAKAAEEKNYDGLQAQIKEVVDNYLAELKGYIPKYQKPEK